LTISTEHGAISAAYLAELARDSALAPRLETEPHMSATPPRSSIGASTIAVSSVAAPGGSLIPGLVLVVLAMAFAATPARAQVRPRIMVAFDTSGSMAVDLNDLPTFGDGVLTNCTTQSWGGQCGTNCTAGMDTNCDGLLNDSRIYIAKRALTDIVLAYGDVDWALSRFNQTQGVDVACRQVNNYECNPGTAFVTSYGNPQCNSGGNCVRDWAAGMPAACRPGTGSLPRISNRRGPDFNVCTNYAGTCTGGDILVGFPDLGPWSGMDNTYGILRWLDGQETNFVNTTTSANYCSHTTSGDCELRPEGGTPLAGLLNATRTYIDPIRDADSLAMCRPYSVILLTDGVESCAGDPAAAATSLRSAGILTYVVGMAITAAGRTQLNSIATAGGTDAGGAGGDTAYFADDPVTLSAGLAEIVERSLRFEVCNGADDDCDTRIDEGVTNACGACGAVPAETCNGVDQDCDGRIDEGVANACGTCGAVPAEVCNGRDDDCDGAIDDGVCGGCTPSTEICDNLDNDCDTRIDESITRSCGVAIGRCTVGTQSCTAGVFGACSGVAATTETCNNVDDDCDGIVDGITRACGVSTGACEPGSQTCTMGAYSACAGGVSSSTETCNAIDDDCDGRTDEMATGTGATCGSSLGICRPGAVQCVGGALTCVGGTSPGVETCNATDDDCDGRLDESVATMGACGSSTGECRPGVRTCVSGAFTCVGARGPATELCNARDDDCDSRTDEGNPGGGLACGTDTGECSPGTSACVAGALACSGGRGPATEACNTRDDDCDGLTDEGNPGGGAACGASDVGLCERGALACVAGVLGCVGEVGPSAELCDALDNDCDGRTDEGNPEGGAMCGDDTGECAPGTTDCVAGTLTCRGGVGPVEELCNSLDDDCDTLIDEGTGLGEACGTDVGECVPGFNVCEAGVVVCRGGIGPVDEACNGLDDDCDGPIDEALPIGEACGVDEGLCMAGTYQCIEGVEICVGATSPAPEGCDCEDNDCDGTTDEAPPGGSLCPAGSACIECQCALPCVDGEFGPLCATGRTPRVEGDLCHCVAPRCEAETCALETVERDGAVLCGGERDDVAECQCRNNACTFACDGVICEGGTVCDPRDPRGRCVEDSCRGLGCAPGELCNALSGECEPDPCDTVVCGATEACRGGTCEASCAAVECVMGERCERGACVVDRCAGVVCAVGQVCRADDGECGSDECEGVICRVGTICDPSTGGCALDPCTGLRCPTGEVCREGECASTARPDAGVRDAGIDSGSDLDDEERVLAAGGGGCICAVGAGADRRAPGSGALALFAVLGLAIASRRRRVGGWCDRGRPFARAAGAALAIGIAVSAGGCDVDPYCLTCREVDSGRADGGPGASGDAGQRDAGPVDGGMEDANTFDGCVEGAPELCNGHDDDCDGNADEGIDTATDELNCGGCGEICAPPGAFGECVAGDCTITMCDVGRFDRDGELENGCETRCLPTAEDDALCDLRDNDCDFVFDEDVRLDVDPSNCGRCGRTCRFVHGAASCEAGACVLGACEAGFYDVDGVPANGCEYACTPGSPAVELCNARDDDCDGRTDEGDPGGGASCGSDVGECTTGIEHCTMGRVVCMGGVSAVVEACNGDDDDCDGATDESNPEGGRLCGSAVGTCVAGREECRSGALVCVGAVAGVAEACNGLDDDCDAAIDEGNPGGGGACGTDTGACAAGAQQCRGGVLTCEGAVGAGTETCNAIDDDCDGRTDEGNPGGGGTCGTDVGICRPGTLTCASGALSCVGATAPRAGGEACNAQDDDCDGTIDEGNPGGGAACGTGTGECTAGAEQCLGGTLQCIGSVAARTETCNTLDDDCDARTDETFTLATDVRNCGMCGRVCSLPNAIERCTAGACAILACETGFVDANGTTSDGCEYACTVSGAEICNGRDDDCDRRTDESLTAPSSFCNPNGVCAGTVATCGGATGWRCTYPATFQATESRCDALDNDCDGMVDEPFPGIGTSCGNGVGACRRTGVLACRADQLGTECTAAAAGTPGTEICNDRDDDCNGVTDDNIPLAQIPTVTVPRATSGTVRVMRYEASRADATASSAGSASRVACSAAGVLPWTTVTWAQANAACCALNAGGTCASDLSGWRLCDAEDWENACEGMGLSCEWGYASACSTSSTTTCNGDEYDSSASSGDQDAVFVTASPTFPMCYADWGSATARIHDLSGNVKEWTFTEVSSGVHQIRGGSYTNVEDGRTCQFDFAVGGSTFAFPNTGFRCCNY
jgi:hypothetical protein